MLEAEHRQAVVGPSNHHSLGCVLDASRHFKQPGPECRQAPRAEAVEHDSTDPAAERPCRDGGVQVPCGQAITMLFITGWIPCIAKSMARLPDNSCQESV